MKEAIILTGGKGLRLRGHTEVPKPFLIIRNEETLLDSQISWLVGHGFEHIILAISRPNFRYLRKNYTRYLNVPFIDFSIEEEQLGTGAGLKQALEYVEEKQFYCFNVDDVCFYNPDELYKASKGLNAILIKKARLPFGTVEFDNRSKMVTGFVEKPILDKYISVGHYVFRTDIIEGFLPEEGDLERTLLQSLTVNKSLYVHVLTGKWITINTYKDLLKAKMELKS